IVKPSSGPIANANGMTSAGGQPCESSEAQIIAVIATTEATDSAIAPVRMTNVMPMATTSRNPLSMKTLKMTWMSENARYWDTPIEYITSSRARVASTGTYRDGGQLRK